MADESEELKERLAQAGWSITDLRKSVIRIEGKEMDATRGAASKGHLRGQFVRIAQCLDDDFIERLTQLGPLTVARRIGDAKLRANVLDTSRAREELVHLEPLLDASYFSAALALVEERGFSVDRLASGEDTYDTFVWTIRARRPGEHLDVDVGFGNHGLAEQGSDDCVNRFGAAELRRPYAVLTVAVHSFARAEELLDVLTLQRTRVTP